MGRGETLQVPSDGREMLLVQGISDEEHQRALFLPPQKVLAGERVVRGFEPRLEIVGLADERLDRGLPAHRSRVSLDAVREGDEGDVVPLSQGDVAEDDRGVEAAVEVGDAVGLVEHRSPAVEQDHDVLVSLRRELAADELVVLGRGPPVDVPDLVSQHGTPGAFRTPLRGL